MPTVIARSIKRRFYVRYEIVGSDGVPTTRDARVAASDPALVKPPEGTRTFSFFVREEGYETTSDGNTHPVRGAEEHLPEIYPCHT
jgi:hypothetical protein